MAQRPSGQDSNICGDTRGGDPMTRVKIKGMSCNHCVMAVTKALMEIDGVKDVEVDLATGEATFDAATPVDMDMVHAQVKKAGYDVG
ncbi:MAG: cation transporter [Thermodesulfobacteriota bacterium]|nr:cation transporter [Thermodesulfobacteriota bacterium]